ncbi:MAG: DUF2318 domain-containing protein [Acidobacteria bacterium]|nr:DUF2318 domain-containing protein [Acidobacteriota bacterium]
MLQALLITLREGVEAALVVGIVLVYLNRTGRAGLARWVWGGVGAAVAASLAGAIALERWKINQEGLEGFLMLLAAVFVVSMIVWMGRVARSLRAHIEKRVDSLTQKSSSAAGMGLAAFVFLLVVREGIELALILRAVDVSSDGVNVWIGSALGLAIAISVGVFFFNGTLKVPLHRFFAATSTILMVVAFQLALTGVHELSEGQWIPSSRKEMMVIGPIVRNDVFFFLVILCVAALLVLREWQAVRKPIVPNGELHPADRRKMEWEHRRQRRWMFASAFGCLLVVLVLAADFLYAKAAAAPPEAQAVSVTDGQIEIPISTLMDGRAHFFSVDTGGRVIRFLAIRKSNGSYAAALDACRICGPLGYRQEGDNVICRNCSAAIYVPSIGESGGCNPIGVESRVNSGQLVISVSALTEAAPPASN